MSQENVEIIRRAYEHFDRTGEFDPRTFDPEIEIDNSNAAFDPAVYDGHRGLGEFLALLREMWTSYRLEPQEFIPVDEDKVIVTQRIVARGRQGVETIARNANVVTFRQGKVIRIKAFQTKAEALEAVGLRE